MLRTRTLLSIWLVLASFSLANSQPQNQEPPRQNGSENAKANKRNPDEGKKSSAVLEIECNPTCAAKNAKEDRNDGHIARLINKTIDDPLTILTGLLAVGTLLLVWVVLCQFRDARDSSKRQLRAYVGLGADDFRFETPGENDPNYIPIDIANPVVGQVFNDFLTIKVKNFGQTPAYDVIVFGYKNGMIPFATTPPDDFFTNYARDRIPTGPVKIFTSRFMLHPQQTAVSKHVVYDVSPLQLGRARQASIYVWGRIYYRDIYKRPWRTRFCYIWEPWHPPSGRFVPYEKHNGEDQTPFQ